MNGSPTIKPAEVMKLALAQNSAVAAIVPGGVSAAPPTRDMQDAGCISVRQTGNWNRATNAPLLYPRFQVTCYAPTIAQAYEMAQAVIMQFHQGNRLVVTQESTGEAFLLHSTMVNGGPNTIRGEDPKYWTQVFFIEAKIGTESEE